MSDERDSPAEHRRARIQRDAELLTDPDFIRGVLANTSEAIEVLDLDARITFISAGALRTLARDDADALLATSWPELWRDTTQAQAAVTDATAARPGRFEGARLTATGTPRWYEVTVSPIGGADGRPARLLAVSRDITERKLARESQKILTEEMHHRVKNVLTMVLAISSQSLARARTVAEGRIAVERRLMALAEAHNELRDSGADGTRLRRLMDGALAPYDAPPSRVDIDGPDIRVSPQAALSLAMALHELCTNAVKYGSLSAVGGRVEIVWQVDEAARRFHLTWREHGGPTVEAPARRGFGTRVIEAGFRVQLGGKVEMAFERSGFVCAVEAPLPALQDEALDAHTE